MLNTHYGFNRKSPCIHPTQDGEDSSEGTVSTIHGNNQVWTLGFSEWRPKVTEGDAETSRHKPEHSSQDLQLLDQQYPQQTGQRVPKINRGERAWESRKRKGGQYQSTRQQCPRRTRKRTCHGDGVAQSRPPRPASPPSIYGSRLRASRLVPT